MVEGCVCDQFRADTRSVGEMQITRRCYRAEFQSRPIASRDHGAFRWLSSQERWDVEWADADVPAVTMLESSRLLD